MNWILAFTLAAVIVATLTLIATSYVIVLELRAAATRRRTSTVWRIIDDSMERGYELKNANATKEQVWPWLDRLARFCDISLGCHARRLVYHGLDTFEKLEANGDGAPRVVSETLKRIHDHIADKIVDGRIRPEFDANKWKGWTPQETLRQT